MLDIQTPKRCYNCTLWALRFPGTLGSIGRDGLCAVLNWCVANPLWFLQAGEEPLPATRFCLLVLFQHLLQVFFLQQIQTHCPLAPPSAQALGFSLHAQEVFFCMCVYGWQGLHQLLSGPCIPTSRQLLGTEACSSLCAAETQESGSARHSEL